MPHLQTSTAETERLTQLVLQCHPAQQLYLLGSTEIRQRTTTVFRQDHPSCTYTSHYFLLSLVNLSSLREPQTDRLCEFHNDRLDALQDKIENTLTMHLVPTTVLVLKLHTFNRWLAEGQGFAYTIIQKGILLHDRDFLLVDFEKTNPKVKTGPDKLAALAFHRRMAKQFWDGAAFYRQKSSNDLAAFMLHQCTEQCLRCLLKVSTGWCPHTHNIDKLVRYCSMTVHKLTEIFQSRTPEQARLYRLLRTAYIDARYNRYVVMDDDIARMSVKVKAVMKLLNAYGKESVLVSVGEDSNP